MRASPSRLLPLALVVACITRGDDPSARATADSARSAANLTAAPSTQVAAAASPAARADSVAAPATVAPPPISSPSDTLCVGVAALAGHALGIAFASDTGSTFPSPRGTGPRWTGCRVRGTGSVRPYSAVSAMPEQRLRAAMRGTGWVVYVSFEASGPVGSAFALRRGRALCHYDILFPGTPGDDESDSVAPPDSSAPPLPYVVHVLCTPSAPPRGS
jgi:hypothetical protein